MTQFQTSWELCRGRYDASIATLTHQQMNWRIHPGAVSIAEMSVHLAGVEAYFIGQGLRLEFDDEQKRIVRSATEGIVKDVPFPFEAPELTPDFVKGALAWSAGLVKPVIENPSDAFLTAQIVTALGPMASGYDVLARIAFHPAYHHGQVYLISTAPGFPASSSKA